MPTAQYTALANVTLGSTASTVTFSSISGSYRDLMLVFNANTAEQSTGKINFNGDTTNTNYNAIWMYGDGSSPYSGSSSNPYFFRYAGNSVSVLNIMDYSATDKHTSVLSRSSDENNVWATTIRWANTAAITSFVISNYGSAFPVGSSFALYGVK